MIADALKNDFLFMTNNFLFMKLIVCLIFYYCCKVYYAKGLPEHSFDDKFILHFKKFYNYHFIVLSIFILPTMIFIIGLPLQSITADNYDNNYIKFVFNDYGIALIAFSICLLGFYLNIYITRFVKFTKKSPKKYYFSAIIIPYLSMTIILPVEILSEDLANGLDNASLLLVVITIDLIVSFLLLIAVIYNTFTSNTVFLSEKYKLDINEYFDNQEKKSETDLLYDILKNGENRKLEAKATLYHDMLLGTKEQDRALDCIKAIAGFLNSRGGTLLIGVEEDFNHDLIVSGSLNLELKKHWKNSKDKFQRNGFSDLIGKVFRSNVLKNIKAEFYTYDKDYLIWKVDVAKCDEPVWVGKPFFKKEGTEKFYLRQEARTIELKGEKLTDHLNLRID